MIVRGLVAGIVLAALIMAGWFLTFQAIEGEVNSRYATSSIP
jgi:hypothetical protein